MRSVKLRSLAKVNLDLRVLHQRPDGFHELRTVFQTISLADTIEIDYEPARRTSLILEGNVDIPNNLILRAAEAVLDAIKARAQVRFRLTKRIPMGGGLGGGSSDAAAILLALPVLAGGDIPVEEIGASLGSDVPFFLEGGTAVGIGRGTEFYGLPDVVEQEILLVSPGLHVATGPAYQALGRGLTFIESSSSINSFQAFVRALGGQGRADLASALSENDFETVVFRQYPKLKKMLGKLSHACGVATSGAGRMTGSGSSIFAVFDSKTARERARAVLEGDPVFRGCQMIPARLVSRRSYQRIWRRQLRDHVAPGDNLWPPRSRYVR
jgi:4-diphosphocytidyl-2-C-methyl-D-erythritol kinase